MCVPWVPRGGLGPAGRATRSSPGWLSCWHHPAASQCLGKQEIPPKSLSGLFLPGCCPFLWRGNPAVAPTLRRPQGNPGEDCGCCRPHSAASLPAGCSISRSASSSSTSAGSTGEAASFTGESLQTASIPCFWGEKGLCRARCRREGGFPVLTGAAQGLRGWEVGGWDPKKHPGCGASLVVGRERR